jgi:DNA-binding protein HU-beta
MKERGAQDGTQSQQWRQQLSITGGNTMTKADLITKVAEKSGLTKKDSAAAVDAYHDVVAESLAAGHNLALVGFGTFEVSERGAREGRNPKTGEKMQIAASKAVKFKPGKALKDSVN